MLRNLLHRAGRQNAAAGAKLRPARDVLTAEKDGLAVLLDLRRSVYFGLDEVGTSAWREIENGATPAMVANRIAEEYDAPANAVTADMRRFIEELRRRHLVVSP